MSRPDLSIWETRARDTPRSSAASDAVTAGTVSRLHGYEQDATVLMRRLVAKCCLGDIPAVHEAKLYFELEPVGRHGRDFGQVGPLGSSVEVERKGE